MDPHNISEEDSKPLLHRLGSDFPCPEGYIKQPCQYTRCCSLAVPHNAKNTALSLNSFEKLHVGRKLVTASDSPSGGLPMVNPCGGAMNGNDVQPRPNMNFGMPLFSPKHAGTVPLNCPGKIDEKLFNFGAGSNTEAKSISNIARINVTGNSEGEFVPPISTFCSQMGSNSFLNPGFDVNSTNTGFQNNNGDISDLEKNVGVWMHSSDNHKVISDARPGLSLMPSCTFQRPAAGDQNHHLSNFRQPQVVGSIQQANTPLGPVLTSDPGIQILTGRENMRAQVSRPSVRPSLKRAAFRPQPFPVQRRKTLQTHLFINPSIPTQTRSATSVPNTAQKISPLTHTTPSLIPQANHSFSHPSIPSSTRSALSVPTIPQIVPPLIYTTPSLPPQACSTVSLTPQVETTSSFLASSQTPFIPHQLLTYQSLPHSCRRAPIMSSVPKIAPVHIKFEDLDQTPEPIGHKCWLCKRDLSYSPVGPISQPSLLPTVTVLPCGHTFHDYCLEQITSDDQSDDPPCIPCALGE